MHCLDIFSCDKSIFTTFHPSHVNDNWSHANGNWYSKSAPSVNVRRVSYHHIVTWGGRRNRRSEGSHRPPSVWPTLKTSNFTLFHQQRWTFLGAGGGQHTRHLPHFLQHLQQLLRWLSTEGQCSDFYFLPIQGNPIGPLVPTTVGLKFGSTYNKTTVKYFSLCLFVTNYCQTCINRLLHPRLPDSVVLFLNTVAHRCLTKQNISKHTFAVIDGWPTKECTLN